MQIHIQLKESYKVNIEIILRVNLNKKKDGDRTRELYRQKLLFEHAASTSNALVSLEGNDHEHEDLLITVYTKCNLVNDYETPSVHR